MKVFSFWAFRDLNPGPTDYEASFLPNFRPMNSYYAVLCSIMHIYITDLILLQVLYDDLYSPMKL